jgi:hypothetical protein
MITFQLEQPLQQSDIDQAIIEEYSNIALVNSRMVKMGIFVIFAVLAYGLFKNLGTKPEDVTTIILLTLPMAFGINCLIHPYLNASKFGLKKFLSDDEKNHYCEAFINMPNMEKHKQYVENVKKQGRKLTSFECDAIIEHYKTLLK